MAIVETQKSYEPRILFFYGVMAVVVLVLLAGVAYRQLWHSGSYEEAEKLQNQRRVLVPGPRGTIYDRDGRVLVGNRPRFSAVLHLAEMQGEFRREYLQVVRNFREVERDVRPTIAEFQALARAAVAQRYLDKVNAILDRQEKVNTADLTRHFNQQLLLPYILVRDLSPTEYARLVEQLPVTGPLQVYSSSIRFYPYATAASHALGYVSANENIPEPEEEIGGEELRTFRLKGTVGKTGVEQQFDDRLQGQTGGVIFRVDPNGFKIDPPLFRRPPVKGGDLTTSIDIDLQLAAEKAMGDHKGGVVALDVHTGEVLVMLSKPDFDLNELTPFIPTAVFQRIEAEGGWVNRAVNGLYPPGSTFKILTAIAGLRAGAITPESTYACDGGLQVGSRRFDCHDRHAHGTVDLRKALAVSCNVFFYSTGLAATSDQIADESRRFGLAEPTGIELPYETRAMIVPDAEWKKKREGSPWTGGDTANMSIGQGYLRFSPLQAACMLASFARRETPTVPTLLRQPGRSPTGGKPAQPLGLSDAQYNAIMDGLYQVVQIGTGRLAKVPGVRIAGKTGTAQITRDGVKYNVAWFDALAPVEAPEIVVVAALEGDQPDTEFGGGRWAAPVVQAVFQEYFAKKARRSQPSALLSGAPRS